MREKTFAEQPPLELVPATVAGLVRSLAVNLATMANLEDLHLMSIVVNSVKDALLADSNAPAFLFATAQQFHANRARVCRKSCNRFVDSPDDLLG